MLSNACRFSLIGKDNRRQHHGGSWILGLLSSIFLYESCTIPQNYSLQVFLNGWHFKTLTLGKMLPISVNSIRTCKIIQMMSVKEEKQLHYQHLVVRPLPLQSTVNLCVDIAVFIRRN